MKPVKIWKNVGGFASVQAWLAPYDYEWTDSPAKFKSDEECLILGFIKGRRKDD